MLNVKCDREPSPVTSHYYKYSNTVGMEMAIKALLSIVGQASRLSISEMKGD